MGVEEIVNNIVAVPIIHHSEFGQKFIEFLGLTEHIENAMMPQLFTGGEYCPTFRGDISGKSAYIVAPYSKRITPQDWAMRVALVSDAAKRAGSEKNVLLAPDLPYSRQDRAPKDDDRMKGQPFSSEVLAKTLHVNGIDHLLTMHAHSQKILDVYGKVFEKKPTEVVTNLDPSPIIAHYLKNHSSLEIENDGENIVFVAPDKGAVGFVKTVQKMCFLPNSSYVYCKKERDRPNDPKAVTIKVDKTSENFGGLEDKTLIFLDDIGDTCGTIDKAYHDLMENSEHGKPKEMLIYFTHPVLAGEQFYEPLKRLQKLGAKEIITTNSRPFIEDERPSDFKTNSTVLRCGAYFASVAVNCIESGRLFREVYTTKTEGDLAKFSDLYDLKRSTMHFMSTPRRPVQLL